MDDSSIKRLDALLKEVPEFAKVVVRFRNRPSNEAHESLFEAAICLEESKFQQWPRGYTSRLDRRPANFGGNQVHIERSDGAKWAYRSTGARSEPSKYTNPTNNMVRDIVSSLFDIPRDSIQECIEVAGEGDTLFVEVLFA